ncbi:MAG: hypothetical protein J0I26_12700 [Alphaproteobacteria bacterium]|nr:hypothetical protein [Alphaproteobacteria bacterium]
MIFKALFWSAVVLVLMPNEPDLGFGRPAAAPSAIAGPVDSFRDFVQGEAVRVRAEIVASEKARNENREDRGENHGVLSTLLNPPIGPLHN